MKRKYIAVLMTIVLSASMFTACGGKSTTIENLESEKNSAITFEEKEERTEEKEVNIEEDLNNWTGVKDHYGYVVGDEGSVSFDISYPSLKPASSGCAYQKDPALILISSPGRDINMENIRVENFEETLITSKSNLVTYIDNFRDYRYKNFDFVIETQELMKINGLDVCKYTGKHTYTLDGVAQEIPFVAYSVDTKQVANTYPTILVMDDSINNSSMEPLQEGTIEAYATKMVESIVISD